MKKMKIDLENLKACVERLKSEFESEKIMELGTKCKSAKKSSIKDCYECAYEIIKAPVNKNGGDGAKGCCTIF